MKHFNIIASFLDPVQGSFLIPGTSEEDAIAKLSKELEEKVLDFKILIVQEVNSNPDSENTAIENTPLTTPELTLPNNVIIFPGNKTKH